MNRNLSIKTISNVVCRSYNIKEKDVFVRTRKREILIVRQVIHYFACKYTDCNLTEIGNYAKTKFVHSSVIHSRKTVNDLSDSDLEFRDFIGYIDYKLKDLNLIKFDIDLDNDITNLKLKFNDVLCRNDLNRLLLSYINFY